MGVPGVEASVAMDSEAKVERDSGRLVGDPRRDAGAGSRGVEPSNRTGGACCACEGGLVWWGASTSVEGWGVGVGWGKVGADALGGVLWSESTEMIRALGPARMVRGGALVGRNGNA